MRRPSAAVSTHKYLSTTPPTGRHRSAKNNLSREFDNGIQIVKIVLFACRSFVRNLEFEGHVFSFELFVPFSYIVYCANLHSFPDSLASYCDRQRHVSTLCNETGIHRVRETSAIYSVILRHSTYSNMSTSGTYILDNIH